jgi:hypothetical protein
VVNEACGATTYSSSPSGCSVGEPGCYVCMRHSCQNSAQDVFFGDPAVRLNSVINQVNTANQQAGVAVAPICGDEPDVHQPNAAPNYAKALQAVANRITTGIGDGCIPTPLKGWVADGSSNNDPDCTVEDDTLETSGPQAGQTIITEIPRCDQANGQFPCWRVEVKPRCADKSPQSIGVTVDRNGQDAPLHTFARVDCATVAATR